MDYLLATHNKKKRDELSRILKPLGINVFIAEDLGIELTDVEETGETFLENALLKSRSGCRESGLPCIADDSGLAVDRLGGRPGVYSARYAGEHGDDEANIALLLSELEGVPAQERTARFVCTVACTYPDGRELTVDGVCEGMIGFEKRGEGGFGYDPVFMVGERSFAELTREEKDAISHRGNALRKFAELLGKAQ